MKKPGVGEYYFRRCCTGCVSCLIFLKTSDVPLGWEHIGSINGEKMAKNVVALMNRNKVRFER